ncbi:MAG: hypothetical protein JKX70_01865 [Phycisphaerales bacterium]|nr:hypothetical protein [Phycisphaerales bacterium]
MPINLSTRFFCVCISIIVQSAHAQSIRPVADRLDAIVSYPLVLPISVANERDLRSGVITKLDDGRELHSQAYWIGLSPIRVLPAWTTPIGIWTATPYETIAKLPKSRRPIGAWFINIPLPIDAVGQGIWFQGERYELNWLPDPQRTHLEANLDSNPNVSINDLTEFWSLKLSADARNDPAVQSAIDQYHHDPFQNWRAILLTDGLDPNAIDAAQSLEQLELELSMDTPGTNILRALALQHQARWQIILGRIWLIDPAVARRLKSQLIATARFGKRTLPVWTSDTADLSRLADDLLSPFVDDQTRVLRAKAWLENQPRALAWITDDQGQIEADSNRFLPTITMLSLPQSFGDSLFRIDPTGSSTELATLSPYRATSQVVAIDPIKISASNPTLETQSIRIRTGRWSTTRHVIASPTPARAPYIRIGPMLNDWTMDALLTDRPLANASPNAAHSAVGILRRTAPPTRTNQTQGWQLYIELASPDPHSPNESLTLWVGPYTSPFAVWTITPDGKIKVGIGSRSHIALPRVQTRILDNRWVAMIDLPTSAFDEDQILQLGLERTDAYNTHTAWPRRMIPDQPEPGRLSIQADNFDQLISN